MPMKDLEEFLEPWLDLPIRGKKYRIHAVDGLTGLYAQQILDLGIRMQLGGDMAPEDVDRLHLDDDQERDFHHRLLGEALDEMLEDRISWEYIKHASRTVFVWTTQDRDAAEDYWERGHRPEGRRPAAPQDRRPKKKAAAKKKSGRPGSPAGSTKTPPTDSDGAS